MADDVKRPAAPVIEIKRKWAHGDQGIGEKCHRKDKPIYTDVNKAPGVCRSPWCDNDEWLAKGRVFRTKDEKKIVREVP